MRRPLVALGLAAGAVLLSAPAAHAGAFFADSDATLLAQRLQEATAKQDVCYGWNVDFTSPTVYGTEPDVGSNLGAGQDVTSAQTCTKYVLLTATVTITSESSESEDSSSLDVTSQGLANAPTEADLAAIGYDAKDLVDEEADDIVFSMMTALPQLVADKGGPALPAATPATASNAAAAPTETPLPDVLRLHGGWLILGGVLILAAVVFALIALKSGAKPAAEAPIWTSPRQPVRPPSPPAQQPAPPVQDAVPDQQPPIDPTDPQLGAR